MQDRIVAAKIKTKQMDLLLQASKMGERAFLTGQKLRDNPFMTRPPSWEYRTLAQIWDEGWYMGCGLDTCRIRSASKNFIAEVYEDYGLPYHPGFVYLLSSPETHFCKIGRTNHVSQRLKRLSTIPPFEYDVTHSFEADDCRRAEAALHGQFADCRQRGEWFALRPDDIAWIQSIVAQKYGRFYFRDDFLPSPYCYSAKENLS